LHPCLLILFGSPNRYQCLPLAANVGPGVATHNKQNKTVILKILQRLRSSLLLFNKKMSQNPHQRPRIPENLRKSSRIREFWWVAIIGAWLGQQWDNNAVLPCLHLKHSHPIHWDNGSLSRGFPSHFFLQVVLPSRHAPPLNAWDTIGLALAVGGARGCHCKQMAKCGDHARSSRNADYNSPSPFPFSLAYGGQVCYAAVSSAPNTSTGVVLMAFINQGERLGDSKMNALRTWPCGFQGSEPLFHFM
jgi:hypothetical protein